MKKLSFAIAAASAALSLSACSKEPETIQGGIADPQASALNQAAPVELPAAVQQSRTYRCKDNSLLFAEFYTDNTARIGNVKDGSRTTLTAPAAGQAYVADGFSLSGNGTEVTFTMPRKGAQTCTAG